MSKSSNTVTPAEADAAAPQVKAVQEGVLSVHAGSAFATQPQQGSHILCLCARQAAHSPDVYKAQAAKVAQKDAAKWQALAAKVKDPALKAAASKMQHKLLELAGSTSGGDDECDNADSAAAAAAAAEELQIIKKMHTKYNECKGQCTILVQYTNLTLVCSSVRAELSSLLQ